MPKGGSKGDPYPGYEKLKRVITLKTRRFMVNKLLQRKQMVLDIRHQHLATPSRKLIRRKIQKMYKVKDAHSIVLFGFKSKYGGGKTKGFCLIYDNFRARKRYDYRHRLLRDKMAKKKEATARKANKEKKNRKKKLAGRAKNAEAK
mmetsp:Transcript_272/g.383  ORF Transcript_272/g.383 Transcript_272/m.383 type:complete len:146 (+) Transcript_272:98-535(+)|eukprot:CAMPEP_0197030434 /NCGR_PEP_ID=MMETSP1384-20130603/9672_1 /TAXON_ID=29189 /ORGANISM="Ammonia sp." /LENGTH=145 /DNA_ID=CAMNT_0042459781 /DNA_START=91 /DNA_END=528 /DNA_ORIENTATION=+